MPNSDTSLLTLQNVSKRFGAVTVLDNVTLAVERSEFLTILGESGSGKTTALRLVAGFEQPNAGEIWMNGTRLDRLPANQRNVNTVFQSYALFPHLSVWENVAYGLRAKKVADGQIKSRVDGALAQMKMEGFGSRRPAQLSGGQQQRVALARALVNRPALLLLDEPLSALDASLRAHMQMELKTLQRETGITFVFVTHDQEEAMGLSDRIAVLRSGRIEQVDTPRNIYNSPRTSYVASLVGKANLLPLGNQIYAVRPENIQLVPSGLPLADDALRFAGTIRGRMFSGPTELLEVECENGMALNVRIPGRGAELSRTVTLHIPKNKLTAVEH